MSGVTVQTMIASSSLASMPRCSSAILAASTARSEVATSGSAMCRSRDADALHDPFVAGLHHLFQILIGQNPGRRVAA